MQSNKNKVFHVMTDILKGVCLLSTEAKVLYYLIGDSLSLNINLVGCENESINFPFIPKSGVREQCLCQNLGWSFLQLVRKGRLTFDLPYRS